MFERWGLRPQTLWQLGTFPVTPSLRQLGASPPDPHWPPAAGGSAPRPSKKTTPLRFSGYAPDPTAQPCRSVAS